MGRPLANQPRLPDVEELRKMLEYSGETGELRWAMRDASSFTPSARRSAEHKAKLWNSQTAGRPAGSLQGNYHKVYIAGAQHLSHRVIWKMITGEEPLFIDHINGAKTDNRIENLQNVTHVVNMKNKSLYATNKTGVPGVEYHKRDGVWRAKIGVDGKQVQLGSYKTKDEAIAARMAGQIMLDYSVHHGRSN